jgi:hypothetical protein
MSTSHYVVSEQSASAWQFSYKGQITGPFGTREEATEAAITEAAESDDPEVEVVVRDANLKTETVWRPNR